MLRSRCLLLCELRLTCGASCVKTAHEQEKNILHIFFGNHTWGYNLGFTCTYVVQMYKLSPPRYTPLFISPVDKLLSVLPQKRVHRAVVIEEKKRHICGYPVSTEKTSPNANMFETSLKVKRARSVFKHDADNRCSRRRTQREQHATRCHTRTPRRRASLRSFTRRKASRPGTDCANRNPAWPSPSPFPRPSPPPRWRSAWQPA